MKKKMYCISKANKNYLILFPLFLLQIILFTQVFPQTYSIKGRVTASRFSILEASVTFIDNADTTKKFSALTDISGNYQIEMPTSVGPNTNIHPAGFELVQNYPNPFSSSTSIPYQLKTQSDIQVDIYDILGRVVKRFSVGTQSAGVHSILWDGRNNSGDRVATGIYFYKLQVGGESQVKKMIYSSGGINKNISLQGSFSTGLPKTNNDVGEKIKNINYTVRVENTLTTLPAIVSLQVENVSVLNDTTINFSVTYLPTAEINYDSLHQYIRGFGAANIIPWRPAMTDNEIETAFGTGEGQLGFTILRLMVQPDGTQWNINVPVAKKASNKGALVFASPWNAPTNMLENVNGQNRVRHDMYNEYAAHLDAYNSYMINNGVPLYAVSVQNEPDYGDWTRWTADEMLTFMKNYAQNINNRIIAPESFQFRRNMSDPILNDSAASANLSIVGGHIYGAGLSAYPLAEQKRKEIWMTEHYTESSHSANTWPLAFDVAKEMQNVMKAGMNAYVWWYIVRYYGPIGDGEKNASYPNENYARKGEVTKRGYLMSQFSRFIRPGFYRVESSVTPYASKVDITAYKDSGSSKIIIVAVNSGTTEAESVFRIQNGFSTTFTPYTTSETRNCEKGNEFTISDGNFRFTMEPLSITTFVSD
jgi:glucuronoarabinoxylan endo-1,4-beta-xylanase